MVHNDPSPLVRFSVFSKDFKQTNCSSGTVATLPDLPKKQAKICFEVLLPQTTFVEFSSYLKTHTVDCRFVSGSLA